MASRDVIERFAGCRAVVVGDAMIDEYLRGDVSRVSPEAPVPVLESRTTEHRLGGAANTAANIRALGGLATLIGVVGQDEAARILADRLCEIGVVPELVVDADRPTTKKTRVVAQQQQIVRIDHEVRHPISGAVADDLRRRLHQTIPTAHVLVLSDYAKGVITHEVARHAISRAREAKIPIVVDPKQRDLRAYAGATVITPNLHELGAAVPMAIFAESAASIRAASDYLLPELGGAALLVTRGADGMSLFRANVPPVDVATAAKEVYDVTGAGDTVVAAIAIALGVGVDIEHAVAIANFAAALSVSKRGTSTVAAVELAAVLG